MIRINNPKALGRINRANILFKLRNEGAKSRLQLARELKLTAASISLSVKELIDGGYIAESGSLQRNATGRKEVLLSFNSGRCAALGLNIERDKTHISLCTDGSVIEERIFPTAEILSGNVAKLGEEARALYNQYKESANIIGAGAGISGDVDEKNGISTDSHGILPPDYPLFTLLKDYLPCGISVINNVKAQARALIKSRNDNFMYVKHSPGIGCAVVASGKVLGGARGKAGELGHTVVEPSGRLCGCGRRGCLETEVSESALESAYFEKTAERLTAFEIYRAYEGNAASTEILDAALTRLALSIGNALALTDPERLLLTGGIFFEERLYALFLEKLKKAGFGGAVELVGNDQKIKAFAGARHILLEKLFEV